MKASNLTLNFALLVAACFSLVTSVAAQESPYPIVLTAGNLDALVSGRLLTSPVPPEKQNSISTIQIGFSETKNMTPVELEIDMFVEDGKVNVSVDDKLLAKIKGQPIRFTVSDQPVSMVILKYDAPMPMAPSMNQAGGEGVVFIRLSENKRMAGTVEGFDSFQLKTAFGDVTIPMKEIAGIKFHTTADDKAVVILSNGDSLTGIPTVPAIKLTTDWGRADISPEFIQSLTATSGAKFRQQNSDFGIRWSLDTGNSFAPAALGN